MQRQHNPIFFNIKSRIHAFSEKFGGIDATPETYHVVRGILDIFSISSFMYIIVFMLMFDVWVKIFPEEVELLTTMWKFAISGAVIHEITWGSAKDWIFTETKLVLFKSKQHARLLASVMGFGFTGVLMAQIGTIIVIGVQERIVGLQIIPAVGVSAGAAIVEEWVFAWGLFSFFYFVMGNLSRNVRLFLSLLFNAVSFSLYHLYVKYIFYGGYSAFLPAIVVSRIVLDILYYFSEGRLSIPMSVHLGVNLFRTIMGGV